MNKVAWEYYDSAQDRTHRRDITTRELAEKLNEAIDRIDKLEEQVHTLRGLAY